jgi:outer membrane protein TolC
MNKLFVLFVAALFPFCSYGQIENRKLSLRDAIEIGFKNNPEIKSALENISASKGKFWSGISLPQPEIGVNYEYAPVNSGLSNYGEKTLSVSQSFEFPSNYLLKANKLNKEEEISVYQLDLTRRSVINRVKSNYYKILAGKYRVKYAEENLLISEDFFKKAEIRHNVGEGTNLEKLTAKVQFTEAKNSLEAARNELSISYAELYYSLGFGKQNYDSDCILTDSLEFLDHIINPGLVYKSLEETNPQIKIAELKSGIASVDKNLAWSSILPNINLSYFRQTRDGESGFYGASFGISVPFWFLFEQRGKVEEAAANKSIFDSELQLTKNEVALKLKSAFNNLDNNLKQVKLYINDILPQAEEVYRSAIKSYDSGELTYFEYLQAKQILISSRNNYINALYNHYQSIFKIEEITGINVIDKPGLENK